MLSISGENVAWSDAGFVAFLWPSFAGPTVVGTWFQVFSLAETHIFLMFSPTNTASVVKSMFWFAQELIASVLPVFTWVCGATVSTGQVVHYDDKIQYSTIVDGRWNWTKIKHKGVHCLQLNATWIAHLPTALAQALNDDVALSSLENEIQGRRLETILCMQWWIRIGCMIPHDASETWFVLLNLSHMELQSHLSDEFSVVWCSNLITSISLCICLSCSYKVGSEYVTLRGNFCCTWWVQKRILRDSLARLRWIAGDGHRHVQRQRGESKAGTPKPHLNPLSSLTTGQKHLFGWGLMAIMSICFTVIIRFLLSLLVSMQVSWFGLLRPRWTTSQGWYMLLQTLHKAWCSVWFCGYSMKHGHCSNLNVVMQSVVQISTYQGLWHVTFLHQTI